MWPAPKWTVAVNSGTRFSGVSKFSDLAAPMPVIIDGSLQDDGSVLATHISILDTDMEKLNVFRGPLGRVDNSRPAIMALGTEQYGYFDDTNGGFGFLGTTAFGYSNASFQIGAGPTSNLSHLPFAPSFDATSMVAGQSISITWHGDDQPALPYLPTASVTLLPQTINGTVQSVSEEGEFQKYIVALPDYDLFPQLASLAMQISPLTDPGTVIVYADSNTARNNTQPIATGSVFRFNGLVFNDAGTLRMACNSVSDGVPE
jgi:hypothetical protein